MFPFAETQRTGLLAGLMLGVAVLALEPASVSAELPDAAWKPAVTERLVRLPSASLKKAIDRDFSSSPLAEAMRDNEAKIAFKLETLHDLQGAIDQVRGEIQVEIKHQYLAEKREYLKLVREQQRMRERLLETRINVYQRLLDKLRRESAAKSPAQTELIERQNEARARLERTANVIDTQLFATSLTTNSKYARQYAKNVAALEALVAKIEAHPHKDKLDVAGDAKTKPDFLRQLLTEAEGDMQVLQQEGEIVGLMAKLVALDALGLQEEIAAEVSPAVDEARRPTIADAVELF